MAPRKAPIHAGNISCLSLVGTWVFCPFLGIGQDPAHILSSSWKALTTSAVSLSCTGSCLGLLLILQGKLTSSRKFLLLATPPFPDWLPEGFGSLLLPNK